MYPFRVCVLFWFFFMLTFIMSPMIQNSKLPHISPLFDLSEVFDISVIFVLIWHFFSFLTSVFFLHIIRNLYTLKSSVILYFHYFHNFINPLKKKIPTKVSTKECSSRYSSQRNVPHESSSMESALIFMSSWVPERGQTIIGVKME